MKNKLKHGSMIVVIVIAALGSLGLIIKNEVTKSQATAKEFDQKIKSFEAVLYANARFRDVRIISVLYGINNERYVVGSVASDEDLAKLKELVMRYGFGKVGFYVQVSRQVMPSDEK